MYNILHIIIIETEKFKLFTNSKRINYLYLIIYIDSYYKNALSNLLVFLLKYGGRSSLINK